MFNSPMAVDTLAGLVEAIFLRANFAPVQAAPLARVVTAGERDACKSHGVHRIAACLATVKAGKAVADATPGLVAGSGAIVRVNAQGGFANAAFELAVPALVARAREEGLAALVINDCVHFAALWPEIEALTAHGLAALAMCPSSATVAPAGGSEPLFGTNPFAFGWPRPGGDPYVFDFATSVIARGDIELYRRAGKPLPQGWAVDAEGAPTTDPGAALAGALLPFGGHKGSALATMIELLAGAMIGDLTSPQALEVLGGARHIAPRHGELILAFDPVRFAAERGTDPFAQAEALFLAIIGQGARLPSQRRYAARAQALAHGIPLSAAELADLERFYALGLAAVP